MNSRLICSDLVSRVMNIDHLEHAINYVDMRKSVHRIGRTARAGKRGDAWMEE